MSDAFLRQFRGAGDRLERTATIDRPGIRLPYAQRILNPVALAASPAIAGDFPQSREVVILGFAISVFVATTNTGAAYWTIKLTDTAVNTLAQVDTSAIAANTWVRLTDTSITQPAASNVVLVLIATATGAPGAIYIVPEVVVG